MDPSDLRADLAERLANSTAIDPETFNEPCFVLSRALADLEFSVPEAAPLVRRLLRVAGREVIDTAAAPRRSSNWSRRCQAANKSRSSCTARRRRHRSHPESSGGSTRRWESRTARLQA